MKKEENKKEGNKKDEEFKSEITLGMLIIIILIMFAAVIIHDTTMDIFNAYRTNPENKRTETTEYDTVVETLAAIDGVKWNDYNINLIYKKGYHSEEESGKIDYEYTYNATYDFEEGDYLLKFIDLGIDPYNKNTFYVNKPGDGKTYFGVNEDSYYERSEDIPQSVYFEEEIDTDKVIHSYIQEVYENGGKVNVVTKDEQFKRMYGIVEDNDTVYEYYFNLID